MLLHKEMCICFIVIPLTTSQIASRLPNKFLRMNAFLLTATLQHRLIITPGVQQGISKDRQSLKSPLLVDARRYS